MPVIDDTYPYVDGTVLDAAGHNSNLYEPAVPGAGIISEFCGGVDADNFDPAFLVQSYHISPGAMVWTASREAVITRDYFSDIFGGSADYQYITVDAVRFRVPFNAGQAIVCASAFISPVMWRDRDIGGDLFHNARTALFFNQLKDVESEFVLPHNAAHVLAGFSSLRKAVGRYAVPRTHFKLLTDASQLMAGTFEVSLKLAIDAETNAASATQSYPSYGGALDSVERKLHARITVGSVSISAVFFKNTNS